MANNYTLTIRDELDQPLSNKQMDDNWRYLDTRITESIDNIALQPATNTTLGTVKIDDNTIKIKPDGTIYWDNTKVPKAGNTVTGGVKINGQGLSIAADGLLSVSTDGVTVSINEFGQLVSLVNPSSFVLAPATTTTLGGVKVDGTTITVDSTGKISALNTGSGGGTATVNIATSTVAGIVKVPGTGISAASDGMLSLHIASNTELGGIKLGTGLTATSDGTVNVTGVTKIVAGEGITVLPTDGTGTVVVSTAGSGSSSGVQDAAYDLLLVRKLPVQPLNCTGRFSAVISYNNSVKSWGTGTEGNLGSGETSNQNTPRHVSYNWNDIPSDDVIEVHPSGNNTFLRTASKKVYGTGKNDNGQLGLGDKTARYVFTRITAYDAFGGVDKFVISGAHSDTAGLVTAFAICGGNVYAHGCNDQYQAGVTTSVADILLPVKVYDRTAHNNVAAIDVVAVFRTTYILCADGTLWATGDNANGQLGVGDKVDKKAFTQCKINSTTNLTNVVKIEAHYRKWASGSTVYRNGQVLAITGDGKLYGAGYNLYGQLGIGNTTDQVYFTPATFPASAGPIVQVSCGGALPMTMAVDAAGNVYMFGRNEYGVFAPTTTVNVTTPQLISTWAGTGAVPWTGKVKKVHNTKVGGNNAYILTTDGKLYGCGSNDNGELGPLNPPTTTNDGAKRKMTKFQNIFTVKLTTNEYIDDFVTLGYDNQIHILALTNKYRLFATGCNSYSQTGISTNNANVFGFSESKVS